MQKIKTNIRLTELGDTALRLVELFKKSERLQADNFLKTLFAEVEQKATALTTAVRNDYTLSLLKDADNERDNSIRTLHKLLQGYEHIPLPELRQHGQKLMAIFQKYGLKIIRENYTSQSNLVASLLEDFSAKEVAISVDALLGVREALAEIQTRQQSFALLRSEYEEVLALQKERASATSLKRPLLELINKKIIPYLTAMNIAKPEMFNEWIDKASEIIDSTNHIVKTRENKHKTT